MTRAFLRDLPFLMAICGGGAVLLFGLSGCVTQARCREALAEADKAALDACDHGMSLLGGYCREALKAERAACGTKRRSGPNVMSPEGLLFDRLAEGSQ